MLVARLNLLGWQISRETLAKVEAQIRWVSDFEILCFAEALETSLLQLYPSDRRAKTVAKTFFDS